MAATRASARKAVNLDIGKVKHVEQTRVSPWKKIVGSVIRAFIIIACVRLVKMFVANNRKTDPADSFYAAWKAGTQAELYIYVSPQPIQTRFVDSELYYEGSLRFGEHFSKDVVFEDIGKPQDRFLYAHAYLCRNKVHPNPDISGFRPLDVAYKRVSLINLAPKPGKTVDAGEFKPATEEDYEPFWYPDLKLAIVHSYDPIDVSRVPAPYRPHITVDRESKSYLPIIYSMEDWQLKGKRQVLNPDNNGKLKLNVSISTRPVWFFKLYAFLGSAIGQASKANEFMAGEYEQLKELLTETSSWLLFTTLLVTVLHAVFDFLAFKNDVQFWRSKRDNLEGLSLRTIFLNVVCQAIITLYLVEQGSSWLIIGSAVVGLLIELWKITKVVEYHNGRLHIRQNHKKTDKYDAEAIKYLSMAVFPLILGYAVYSYTHMPHNQSTYSFALHTAVGFVYAFGFIMMTPQLYVNWKLKSVAHMPWRAFTYKALNTVVDDLFAFAVRMPVMHRISCFRDDILFLVYLYQRWIYPTDMTRMNEYGQSFAVVDTDKKQKKRGKDE